ncbi:MAG: hypothetical protein LAT50_09640 [Ectothiorhodospiraceae bacterium]|nr:hypothetical protein [Ectothiorhodospiraceae bacterium]
MYFPESMATPALILVLITIAVGFWVRYFRYTHDREKKRAEYRYRVRSSEPVGRLSPEQRYLLDKVLEVEVVQQGLSPELSNGVGRIGPEVYRERGEVQRRMRQAPSAPRMHGGGTVAAVPHHYHEINGVECWLSSTAMRHIRRGEDNVVEFVMAEKTAIVVRINDTYDLFAQSGPDGTAAAFGDIITSESVAQLCLSPLPLPTLHQPFNGRRYIKTAQEHFLMLSNRLEYGAQDWQFAFGLAMFAFSVLAVFPVAVFILLGLLMGPAADAFGLAAEMFGFILPWTVPLPLLLFGFVVYRVARYHWAGREGQQPPVYFHRQRREVAFVDPSTDEVVVCPWEATEAWLEVVRGPVHGHHPKSLCLCFGGSGLAARHRMYFKFHPRDPVDRVIAQWEAVREYMEGGPRGGKTPFSLGDYQQRVGPFRESTATWLLRVSQARARYAGRPAVRVFWWLKEALTLFVLPYWISGFEYRYTTALDIRAAKRRLGDWMRPVPEGARAKPSEEYAGLVAQIESSMERDPDLGLEEVFLNICDKPESFSYRRAMRFRPSRAFVPDDSIAGRT